MVSAKAYAMGSGGLCYAKWKAPTMREHLNKPLPLSEISHYTVYADEVLKKDGVKDTSYSWWSYSSCPNCIKATATDTDGHVSVKSECLNKKYIWVTENI